MRRLVARNRVTLRSAMKEPGAREQERIRGYVELELEASVSVAERVMAQKVLGTIHEIWNVHTDDGARWWVVTPLTNLYSQDDFAQARLALTYHIGLRVVMIERSRAERSDEEKAYAYEAWRKFEQAVEGFNAAQEAEGYQAVGVLCREALMAFVRGQLDDDWEISRGEGRPPDGDFKRWTNIFALNLTQSRRLRSYLRAISSKTWDLVVWLQHYTDATQWDAEVVLDGTENVLAAYSNVMARFEKGHHAVVPSADRIVSRWTMKRTIEESGSLSRYARRVNTNGKKNETWRRAGR